MANLVAVDLSPSRLTVVAGRTASKGKIIIDKTITMNLAELVEEGQPPVHDAAVAEASTSENPVGGSDSPKERKVFDLFQQAGIDVDDVDATLAAFHLKNGVSEKLTLPFKDNRKIEQTAPLQLQDVLPFDLDEFVVDSFVTGDELDGQYPVFSSIAPKKEIAEVLALAERVGIQPRTLTTRAAAITALVDLFPETLKGTFALLEFHEAGCSLAIFIDDKIAGLRECSLSLAGQDYIRVLRDVRCAIEGVAREQDKAIEVAYVLNIDQDGERELSQHLGVTVKRLTLDGAVDVGVSGVNLDQVGWAAGLFAAYENRKRQLDFRKGEYAYKPAWGQLLQAFSEEMTFIGWAVVLLLIWGISEFYTAHSTLARINRQIASSIVQAMPGEIIPYGSESRVIGEKVTALEEQLRGMGTLSSLSPLASLLEISQAVAANVDISIDTFNIGQLRLTFSGTLPDNVAIGRLNTVLEQRSDRFCKVKVDPKGKVPGSTRVRFVADIELCD